MPDIRKRESIKIMRQSEQATKLLSLSNQNPTCKWWKPQQNGQTPRILVFLCRLVKSPYDKENVLAPLKIYFVNI